MNVGDIVVPSCLQELDRCAARGEVGIIIWASWSFEQTVQDIKEEVTRTRNLWDCKVLWSDGTIHTEDADNLEVISDPG